MGGAVKEGPAKASELQDELKPEVKGAKGLGWLQVR